MSTTYVRVMAYAVLTAAWAFASSGGAYSDEATVMRNLKYHCGHLNEAGASPYDRALLRCTLIQDDPDILKMVINDQITNMCQSIQEQCRAPGTEVRKARLSNYLTTLSCTERGFTCLSGASARSNICDQGNVNVVVQVIDQIEHAGGRVPRALRRAVRAYAEACAINRATQTALANVNTELRAFYDNKHVGCLEAGFEGTANECTAAIDRAWQMNSVQAMFNWGTTHSIVSQVSLDTVRRWTGLNQ